MAVIWSRRTRRSDGDQRREMIAPLRKARAACGVWSLAGASNKLSTAEYRQNRREQALRADRSCRSRPPVRPQRYAIRAPHLCSESGPDRPLWLLIGGRSPNWRKFLRHPGLAGPEGNARSSRGGSPVHFGCRRAWSLFDSEQKLWQFRAVVRGNKAVHPEPRRRGPRHGRALTRHAQPLPRNETHLRHRAPDLSR